MLAALKGKISKHATLDDVFAQMTGQPADGGNCRDVRRTHRAAREHAKPDSVQSAMGGYLTQLLAVADAELRKLRHDPWELASHAIQPVLWLLLFGNVMARVRGLAPQATPYLEFLATGIIVQSALFVAICYGISAIWERDLGVLHRHLVSPAPRSAPVAGKALSSAVRALSQAVIVYFCAAAMSVHLSLRPTSVTAPIPLITLRSALFSTVFPDHRVHRTHSRALHGDRQGTGDADILREQRH